MLMRTPVHKTISIGLIVLIILSWSGCVQQYDSRENSNQSSIDNTTDQKDNDQMDVDNSSMVLSSDLLITDYQVKTKWIVGCCGDFEYPERAGFYHQLASWSNSSYQISGNLKNTGTQTFSLIDLTIQFINDQGELVFNLSDVKKKITIRNLTSNQTVPFSVNVSPILLHEYNDGNSFQQTFQRFHQVDAVLFNVSNTIK